MRERVTVDPITVSHDTLDLTFIRGATPADSVTSRLVSVYRHTLRETGALLEQIDSVIADTPTVIGQKVNSGRLFLYQAFTDNTWVKIRGTFSGNIITATYTDSKGDVQQLSWDRNGNPLK